MNFWKNFRKYIRMENRNYKNELIERKYLENMLNNQFWRVKDSLSELENFFTELKDIELKDRKEKRKKS